MAKDARAKEGTGPDDDRVLLGAITGARGLKGEVRIKSFTQVPDAIGDYGPLESEDGARTFVLRIIGQHKGQLVVRIEGIGDRTQADALKGTRLYARRQALPEAEDGEYYVSDLIGLAAETDAGEALGTVVRADDFGAGWVLELSGGEMVPFTDAAVPVVDLEKGRIQVHLAEELEVGDEGKEGENDG